MNLDLQGNGLEDQFKRLSQIDDNKTSICSINLSDGVRKQGQLKCTFDGLHKLARFLTKNFGRCHCSLCIGLVQAANPDSLRQVLHLDLLRVGGQVRKQRPRFTILAKGNAFHLQRIARF